MKFCIRKLSLNLLAIICLIVAGWAGYLLFIEHQIDPTKGSIISLVAVGFLIWSISVLRNTKYRWRKPSFKLTLFSVIAIVLFLAFAGIQPLTNYKDNLIAKWSADFDSRDGIIEILPGQSAEAEGWFFALNGGNWEGSTLTIELTIANLGARRGFGWVGLLESGPELVVIDSTRKLVEPWVPEADIRKGELFYLPPYTKEFYPNESWSGSLKFEMSPYSGETKLYMTKFSHMRKYLLFNLGSPSKD